MATKERRDDDMIAPLFIDVDGITTRYFEAGHVSSPTLVLIHGGDYDYREVASATEWLKRSAITVLLDHFADNVRSVLPIN